METVKEENKVSKNLMIAGIVGIGILIWLAVKEKKFKV